MNNLKRAIGILINPKYEWEIIKTEQTTTTKLFKNYAMLIALIPAVAIFIGQSVIGLSLGEKMTYRIPIINGILFSSVYYAFNLLGLYLLAKFVDVLSQTFGAEKNFSSSLKVVIYSFTPFAAAGIVRIVISFEWLHLILGLYTFYLMYLGLKTVKEIKPEKLPGYLTIVFMISVILYMVSEKIAVEITMPVFGQL